MTSDLHVLWDVLLPYIRPALPYPDRRRRQRIRREAVNLAMLPKWPGNNAEPLDVARLAMRRLLYLQTETHRAVLSRQREAAALLARSAVETCITGLYYLYSDDSVERLRRDTGRLLTQILTPVSDPHLLTGDLIQAISESVTGNVEPGQRIPDLYQLAQEVERISGKSAAKIMYDQEYRSLSTLFAHSRGLALLRHVDSDENLLDDPEFPWLRRSAARVADACVGVLADALASAQGAPAVNFGEYADDHWRRVMHPIGAAGSKGLLRSIDWKNLPNAWTKIKESRRYLNSEQAKNSSPELVSARIRKDFGNILQTLCPKFSEAELDLLLEHFAPHLASSVESPMVEGDAAENIDTADHTEEQREFSPGSDPTR